MSAATSSRSCATSSRSASAWCATASARTCRPTPRRRPRSACSTRWSAPAPARRRAIPSARKLRAGELDDKEIEIEVPQGSGGMPDVRAAQHAGRVGRRDLHRRHVRQGLRRAHQDAPHDGEGGLRAADRRGERQAARPGPDRRRGDPAGREQRHRLPRRDRQDLRPRGPRRRRRVARGRAARPAAADRGHDRRDQARRGEDRPHPVHRVGRLPRLEAVGPAAGAAGPPADPRRAVVAQRGRLPPHPDRDRGEPHQAVRGAAARPRA